MGFVTALPRKTRDDLRRVDEGLIGETIPRYTCSTSLATGSGAFRYTLIGLRAGDVATNVIMGIQTAGATFSGVGARIGLYSKAGTTLLASTTDFSASLTAGAPKLLSVAFSAPYTVTADGSFYLGIIQIATTTAALDSSGQSGAGAVIGTGSIPFGQTTSLTDLPASMTFTANSSGAALWFGIS